MNFKMIFHMLGKIITLEGVLMTLPLFVSVLYNEHCLSAFLIAIGISLLLGITLLNFFRPKDRVIFAKEGFILVALTWIISSVIGALPFVISGEIPSFIDAFFETVSGFTTTGASILTGVEVEAMSHGLLFWRSFTHWIGGMGVLVLMIALLPSDSGGRTIHILRAEMPGPVVGKLVPKARDTAKILYYIYFGMTVAQIIFLLAGGMNLFDAVVHTFGTAGTGGFGVRADSMASFSPYIQWVITIFMLLFGVNFNLYYMILLRRFKSAFRSEEFWCYFGIVGVSTLLIAWNVSSVMPGIGDSVRHSSFQVASFLTTTGYSTVDYNAWPGFSKVVLLLLMFIGGCAGSTAGGLKVSRVVLLWKSIRRNLRELLHPHSVSVVRFEGKTVEDDTIRSVNVYFAVYFLLMGGIFLLLSLEPFSIEANLTATISCVNNIGPAFGEAAASYAIYSPAAKVLLSFAMLLGRLEIYPLIIFFIPYAWRRK